MMSFSALKFLYLLMAITQYHRDIEELKWGNGFKCRHCNFHIAYKLPDLSRKCAKCKRKESLIAHTAFHGLRIELDIAMNILFAIQSHWNEYLRGHEHGNRQGQQARLSVKDLALMFKIDPKMVWRFLNRIIEWLPRSFHKRNSDVEQIWFQGIDKKNRLRYYALYNFLIEGNEFQYLEILVNKYPSE